MYSCSVKDSTLEIETSALRADTAPRCPAECLPCSPLAPPALQGSWPVAEMVSWWLVLCSYVIPAHFFWSVDFLWGWTRSIFKTLEIPYWTTFQWQWNDRRVVLVLHIFGLWMTRRWGFWWVTFSCLWVCHLFFKILVFGIQIILLYHSPPDGFSFWKWHFLPDSLCLMVESIFLTCNIKLIWEKMFTLACLWLIWKIFNKIIWTIPNIIPNCVQ